MVVMMDVCACVYMHTLNIYIYIYACYSEYVAMWDFSHPQQSEFFDSGMRMWEGQHVPVMFPQPEALELNL